MPDDIAQAFGLARLGSGDTPSALPRLSELVDAEPPDDWRDRAACHPRHKPETVTLAAWVNVFFPERGQATRPARAFCERCPVVDQCRAQAMGPPKEGHGIWGDTSERQRRSARRGRQRLSGISARRTDNIDAAARLRDEGMPVVRIAARLAVTEQTVYDYLKAAGRRSGPEEGAA